MKWTAREIARSLAFQVFNHRHLLVVPNTYWPGSETDMLLVRTDLRLMDVEIKISRGDLRADAGKDKWFDQPISWSWGAARPPGTPRTHPRRIWKHYYCLPKSIWKDDLLESIKPSSGIILMNDHDAWPNCSLYRQAKPAKNAERISLEELVDIARVQSHRMWESFDEIDRHNRQIALDRAPDSANEERT